MIVFNEIFIREVNDVRSVCPDLSSNSTRGQPIALTNWKTKSGSKRSCLLMKSASQSPCPTLPPTKACPTSLTRLRVIRVVDYQFGVSNSGPTVIVLILETWATSLWARRPMGDNKVSCYAAGIVFYDGCHREVVQLAYELRELLEVSIGDFGLVVDWKDCRLFNLMLLSRRLALLCFVPKSDTENPPPIKHFGKYKWTTRCPPFALGFLKSSSIINMRIPYSLFKTPGNLTCSRG